MNIKPTDRFTLSEKSIKREEFLKRISNLKWDNAEVLNIKYIQIQKDNKISIII